jgi:hypothetical protein
VTALAMVLGAVLGIVARSWAETYPTRRTRTFMRLALIAAFLLLALAARRFLV